MLYYTEMYTDFNWTIYFMEIYTADCTELHRKYMELYIFLNYTKGATIHYFEQHWHIKWLSVKVWMCLCSTNTCYYRPCSETCEVLSVIEVNMGFQWGWWSVSLSFAQDGDQAGCKMNSLGSNHSIPSTSVSTGSQSSSVNSLQEVQDDTCSELHHDYDSTLESSTHHKRSQTHTQISLKMHCSPFHLNSYHACIDADKQK